MQVQLASVQFNVRKNPSRRRLQNAPPTGMQFGNLGLLLAQTRRCSIGQKRASSKTKLVNSNLLEVDFWTGIPSG